MTSLTVVSAIVVVTLFGNSLKEAYYLGDVGQGARMKLVVNSVMGAHMAALSEGIQLAKKSDLDCDVLHDVLCKGALSSPLVQVPSDSIDYCK